MIKNLQTLISQKGYILEAKDPFFVTVPNGTDGLSLAKDILYASCDFKTALYLSGGRTPKEFYNTLATEEKLSVGTVGLVDERFGEKMHEYSNEAMIQESGLLHFLKRKNIPFHPILQPVIPATEPESRTLEETAQQYDEQLRVLWNGFPKSVGILGIGLDGHIAGIPIYTSIDEKDHSFVTSFSDFPGPQKERISMTFLGLSMLDFLLVLVFGNDKLHALQAMMADGSEEDIPARFFKRSEIAQKTLIITDQIM